VLLREALLLLLLMLHLRDLCSSGWRRRLVLVLLLAASAGRLARLLLQLLLLLLLRRRQPHPAVGCALLRLCCDSWQQGRGRVQRQQACQLLPLLLRCLLLWGCLQRKLLQLL
jgi:hypothetical protein